MIYATIDIELRDHERAIAAKEAMALWTWGMLYDKAHKRSGNLPRAAVLACPWCVSPEVAASHAASLVTVGLWCVTEDGWSIFRHAEKNETRDQIESRMAKSRGRSKALRLRKKASIAESLGSSTVTRAGEDASRVTPALRRDALRCVVSDQDPEIQKDPVTAREPKTRRGSRCPESSATPADVTAWVERWGIPGQHGELAAFLDHHRKSGTTFVDWAAAWRTWLRNAAKFALRPPRSGGRIVQQAPPSGSLWAVGEDGEALP